MGYLQHGRRHMPGGTDPIPGLATGSSGLSNDFLTTATAILPTVTEGGSSFNFPDDYTFTGTIEGTNEGATLDSWQDPILKLIYSDDGIGGADYSVWYQGVVPQEFDADPDALVTVNLGITTDQEIALLLYYPITGFAPQYPASAMELTQFLIDTSWNVNWNTLLGDPDPYPLGVVTADLSQGFPFYVEIASQNDTSEAADPIFPAVFTLEWEYVLA